MIMPKEAALILAAGKGTRMHSLRPKVLQTLLGETMLCHVREALRPVFGEDVWIVVGHGADMVREAFPQEHFVQQEEQLGTGHALQTAMPSLEAAGVDRLLVVNGDTPLLTAEVVRHFLQGAGHAPLAFATISLDDPAAYGRVVRHDDGSVQAIVEAKDYDLERYGAATGEVNAGMYLLDMACARALLPRITNTNRSGEYYITDLVGLAVSEGMQVVGVQCGNDTSLLGINSPLELAACERLMQDMVNQRLMASGVMLHAPESVRISPLAQVEPGAEITGPCEIYGASFVGSIARIASHCVLDNSRVEGGAQLRSFCHLEKAHVGPQALVGPYARLRPGAELEEGSHVGNFVELKKTRLGKGAKANHLSYLGDSVIGAHANIGAGTITCNYDGQHKYQTHIGERAFIGSNTALVAPVRVGDGALVGAGSVITKDVPDKTMGIARGRQKNLPRRG